MRIELTQAAQETRRRLQQEAREIGISEDYISLLVDEFYIKVRAHPVLGPVFNDVVLDHWPEHLEQMKLFWASVALRTGNYNGRPMPIHMALTNARPEHFPIWQQLWRETLRETAPNQEVIDAFTGLADVIGDRLSKGMFS